MVAFSTFLSASTALFLVALPAVLANPSPEPSTSLFARQINPSVFDPSTVPSSCQSSCSSVSSSLSGCSDLNCICSNTIVQGLASCLDCGVGVKGSPLNVTYAQSLMNTFTDACKQGGVNVSPVTIKGSSSSSSSGSGSGSGSSNSATRTGAISGAALTAIALLFTFA